MNQTSLKQRTAKLCKLKNELIEESNKHKAFIINVKFR